MASVISRVWLVLIVALAGPACAERISDRERFIQAWEAAGRADREALAEAIDAMPDYVLTPYLEFEFKRQTLDSISVDEMTRFLARYRDWSFAAGLETAWLRSLGRRGEFDDLARHGRGARDAQVRCWLARADIAAGRHEGLADRIAELWLVGRSQTDVCDPAFDWWRAQGYPTHDQGWQRFGLALNAGRELFERGDDLVASPAEDPALEAATVLIELLEDADVAVADDDPAHVDADAEHDGEALATIESPPLDELLVHTVQESDNHLADGLWRLAAAEEGEGTWDSAEALTRSALARRGIDPTGARLPDGSGLSRDARLTARQLVRLDAIERAGPDGGLWTELMAVAGESGTLRRRLTGTEAEGLLRGKTGTLRDARSLTAHVQGPTGRWHLAVMADELDGEALGEALPLIDDLALILTRDLLGCDLEGCNEDEDVPTSGHDHVS